MKQDKCVMLLVAVTVVMFVMALSLPMLPSVSAQAQATDEPWPQFGQNPANTRATNSSGPTNLGLDWRFQTGGGVFSSPAECYGNVYFGSQDQYWYCLNAQTGALVWKVEVGWRIRTSPCVRGGYLYTGDDDGYFYCFNAYTGALVWKTKDAVGKPNITEMSPGDTFNPRSSPNVVNGMVYCGSMDSNFYCLSTSTGAVVWKFKTGGPIACSPAVANGRVFFGSGDAYFYCLNATTGVQIWKSSTSKSSTDKNFQNTQMNGPPVVIGSRVIYFSLAGAWLCENATTGADLWAYHTARARAYTPFDNMTAPFTHPNPPTYLGVSTNPSVEEDPAYNGAGSIYCNEDFWMLKLNITNGASEYNPWPNGIFNYNLFTGFVSYPSTSYAAGSQTIYTASAEKSVYCNSATSAIRYSWYETQGQIQSSPSIAYGNVYVGSWDTYLYCLNGSGPVRNTMEPSTFKTNENLTASLSTPKVQLYQPITISGGLTPPPPADPVRGGEEIKVNFTRPDGSLEIKMCMTEKNSFGYDLGNGQYSFAFTPDETGTWTVHTEYRPSIYDPYNNATSQTLTFNVLPISYATPTTAASTIVAGLPDVYVYGFVAIIIIIVALTLLATWYARRRK